MYCLLRFRNMKTLIALALLCAVLSASAVEQMERDDIIEAVNKAQTTWTVRIHSPLILYILYIFDYAPIVHHLTYV